MSRDATMIFLLQYHTVTVRLGRTHSLSVLNHCCCHSRKAHTITQTPTSLLLPTGGHASCCHCCTGWSCAASAPGWTQIWARYRSGRCTLAQAAALHHPM